MPDHSSTYNVRATARLAAAPSRVYSTIADYRNGHPRILPPQFTSLTVAKGGIGQGTEIDFAMNVWGRTYDFHAIVTEPEPGRVLVEQNSGANAGVTTFIVDPGSTPQESVVTISTEMPYKPGLFGALERYVTRKVMLPMYAEELRKLEAVARADESRPPGSRD
jgi:hypothetical protein